MTITWSICLASPHQLGAAWGLTGLNTLKTMWLRVSVCWLLRYRLNLKPPLSLHGEFLTASLIKQEHFWTQFTNGAIELHLCELNCCGFVFIFGYGLGGQQRGEFLSWGRITSSTCCLFSWREKWPEIRMYTISWAIVYFWPERQRFGKKETRGKKMTKRSREENVGKPLKMVCENVRMFAAMWFFTKGCSLWRSLLITK